MWPKKAIQWIENRTLYVSIPFTWNLPEVRQDLEEQGLFWDKAIVGGPAVKLMPDYFNDLECVSILDSYPGVLQKTNQFATKTTVGCPNKCGFCAVPKTEGNIIELEDWPDLPIICDNNLLSASIQHFDRVIDRLKKHKWCDFNQGLDARLLTEYHVKRIREIRHPIVRLALDSSGYFDIWRKAYELLRKYRIPLKSIRTYILVGYKSDPHEAWIRLNLVRSTGSYALPQWYHSLNAMKWNQVTEEQENLGWNETERQRIMQYFYKHKGEPLHSIGAP